jgi:hypothetical protein
MTIQQLKHTLASLRLKPDRSAFIVQLLDIVDFGATSTIISGQEITKTHEIDV